MKKFLNFIIAAIAVFVCSFLVFSPLDKKAADIFQRPLKSTVENPKVIMIGVDDYAVNNIGSWPFSRDTYAKIITVLKDFGTESVVFDLSFLDKSQAKVDQDYVTETLPRYLNENMDYLNENIEDVMDYYKDGMLVAEDSENAKEMLIGVSDEIRNTMNSSIAYVMRNIDDIFANSIQFGDNVYLSMTFDNSIATEEEDKKYLEGYVALDNLEIINDTKTPEYEEVQPSLIEFIQRARAAGYVNADPDSDGYLRRLNLLVKYNGKYYGQLVFVPLLAHYGYPKIEVTNNYITLKNAKIDESTVKDIKIPRDEYGKVIIKYPKKAFLDYNYVSLWDIYRISVWEEKLAEVLKAMSDSYYFEYWYGDDVNLLFEEIKFIREELKNGENLDLGITYEMYEEYKKAFYTACDEYLNNGGEELLIEVADGDDEMIALIKNNFSIARDYFNDLVSTRENYKELFKDSFCIIGTCASSTSDYGVTQYDEFYPKPGVHYSLANQIMSQDFVDDSPVWLSIIIAIVLCFLYVLITSRIKSTGKQIIVGIGMLVISAVLIYLYFYITRIYPGFIVPMLSLFATFVASTVAGFLTSSHEKRFIQNAFSQCLAPAVVQDLVDHPENFKLGGDTYDMSAIFTDIQKFSGFSELLTAAQLVALLNYYLTKMSDTLMEEGATVDKYEGDAIVAFVGAPINYEDHAKRICRAAINMKKHEEIMNKEITDIAAMETAPEGIDKDLFEAFKIMVKNDRKLFTRIGINSGDMVAGYMGSNGKKNYTMMGNNVNLASRLEGVNKQYSTGGILMSEATRNKLDDEFLVRSLDRVRVVNVNTPIRLYELIETKANATEFQIKYVQNWEIALKNFEAKNYEKALEQFKILSSSNPKDNVVKYYIDLTEKFFIQGKYPTEFDDAGVAYNPEDGVFKLLQK